MEGISWITTPKCAVCKPEPCFEHRYTCIGCEKLHKPRKDMAARRKIAKPPMSAAERSLRDKTVGELRAQGLSYGAIAEKLGAPRSTVQGIAERACAPGHARDGNKAKNGCINHNGESF